MDAPNWVNTIVCIGGQFRSIEVNSKNHYFAFRRKIFFFFKNIKSFIKVIPLAESFEVFKMISGFIVIAIWFHSFFFWTIRVWFMQPSRDLDVLKRRLDAVSYFVNPRNAEVTSSFQDALKQIKNVPVSKDHKPYHYLIKLSMSKPLNLNTCFFLDLSSLLVLFAMVCCL